MESRQLEIPESKLESRSRRGTEAASERREERPGRTAGESDGGREPLPEVNQVMTDEGRRVARRAVAEAEQRREENQKSELQEPQEELRRAWRGSRILKSQKQKLKQKPLKTGPRSARSRPDPDRRPKLDIARTVDLYHIK